MPLIGGNQSQIVDSGCCGDLNIRQADGGAGTRKLSNQPTALPSALQIERDDGELGQQFVLDSPKPTISIRGTKGSGVEFGYDGGRSELLAHIQRLQPSDVLGIGTLAIDLRKGIGVEEERHNLVFEYRRNLERRTLSDDLVQCIRKVIAIFIPAHQAGESRVGRGGL